MKHVKGYLVLLFIVFAGMCNAAPTNNVKTIALWLFDEQVGLYPSSVLEDNSDNNIPLVLGLGGQIAEGKFGNALDPVKHGRVLIPDGEEEMGLRQKATEPGRTVAPLSWYNANFAALMTSGEKQLRKEIGFQKPTETKLNLGDFDWTVEFWFFPERKTKQNGVVFEIGTGPRGENGKVTKLELDAGQNNFVLINEPSDSKTTIPTHLEFERWNHVAFTYSAKKKQLSHYVNGMRVSTQKHIALKSLENGDEDYMSICRDGLWNDPLQGKIDELRFSEGMVYTGNFSAPLSFASVKKVETLVKGPELLFENTKLPIQLEDRKHLFIDDAMIDTMQKDLKFVVNPPRKEEIVLTNIKGSFRKHLTVVEDDEGKIRLYNSTKKDYLQVLISDDGIHFTAPDLGTEAYGQKNFVITDPVGGLGNPFIDPCGTGDARWKYITGYYSRGTYLFTSPDGLHWKRQKRALIPFRNGTQSCTFYDDQRQTYVSYHRTGIHHSPAMATERASVKTETKDLFEPIKYKPLTQADYWNIDKKERIRDPLPWWLDNGPLTPGDWGREFPVYFHPDIEDPVGTDIYITKAIKYPWAPDTYLSFPIVFFHYFPDGPVTRNELGDPSMERGEGPIETQIAVSRNGIDWKRMYRPAYVGIGEHDGIDTKTAYIAQGMVRRGREIWQYYFAEPYYHSAYKKNDEQRAVIRLVQRLDGFVSIDSPYDREACMTTKPFIFKGNCLELNINTEATGYAQVGIVDEQGNPIKGFGLDDCIYINGDFINTKVEWIKNRKEVEEKLSKDKGISESLSKYVKSSTDVSALQGKTVRLVFRMRGSKLYALQFINE